jgi:hypothetical protein
MGKHGFGKLTVGAARRFVSNGGGQSGFHKTGAGCFHKNDDAGFGHP